MLMEKGVYTHVLQGFLSEGKPMQDKTQSVQSQNMESRGSNHEIESTLYIVHWRDLQDSKSSDKMESW